MRKQLMEVVGLLADKNERLKARVDSLEKAGIRLSEMNTNQAKTVHQLNKACFRMRRRLRAGRLGGYQPDHGTLDSNNPPRGGSGVPGA